MPEVAPPRNLTPGLCKAIEAEMLRACAEVAARHGLMVEGLGVQAMDLRWNFEFGVRVGNAQRDLKPQQARGSTYPAPGQISC